MQRWGFNWADGSSLLAFIPVISSGPCSASVSALNVGGVGSFWVALVFQLHAHTA